MMSFFEFYVNTRKKSLRHLARLIIYFVVVCWLFLWLMSEQTYAGKENYIHSGTYGWALIFSGYLLVVSLLLHQGKAWAWWGAFLGFQIPMCILTI